MKCAPILFTAFSSFAAAGLAAIEPTRHTLTVEAAPNGHHLQWSDGTPFFINADTAWTLPYAYADEEVVSYLDQRVGSGFNTIQMSALFGDPKDERFHEKAFTEGDLAKPLDAYWKRVDWVVEQTTRRGFVVIINPIWKRHFNSLLQANGVAKSRAFGAWFAKRYRENPRVLYFIGGDQVPEPVREELDAMGQGIQDVYAGRAIVAFHSEADQSSLEAYPNASWITLNWTYAYAPPYREKYPYETNWANFGKSPRRPIQFGEGFYDFGAETKPGPNGQRARWAGRFALRRQAWWGGFLTGASGCAYGAEAIWMHNRAPETWQMAMAYESGRDMRHVKTFADAIPWWTLQPDREHRFLSGGFGEWRTDNFAVAAVSSDRSLAVVYTPVSHTLEVRLDQLRGGQITARWFDPSSGEYTPAELPPPDKKGTTTLLPPARNRAGDADFALILNAR